MIYYYTPELINYQNNKSKYLFFDNIFLNVHFLVTIAYTDFKVWLLSPHIHSERTVSQISDLGLGFYFMSKNGKHFLKMLSIIFEVA